MNKPITLHVYEIVGSSLCVASEDGQKVFEQVQRALKDGKKVALSFQNVESLTSAFLNAAIGQLYGVFSHEIIKKSLSVKNIENSDLGLLKRVIEIAKQYFQDPTIIESAREDILGADNE